MFEYDRIRKTKTFCSACMCYDLIRTFCMDEKVCLLLCMEESLFCFRKMTMTTWHLDWSHVIVVTIYGICLRHCDNSWSFERCFVAVDRICCCEMLVGGTAEVQLRDPCTLTHMLLASYNILYYNNRQLVLFATLLLVFLLEYDLISIFMSFDCTLENAHGWARRTLTRDRGFTVV